MSAFVALMGGCIPAKSVPTIDAITTPNVETGRVAGAALVVSRGGETLYQGAAGCAEFETDGVVCARPMAVHAKARVASVSKAAAALAVLTLVDDGRLDLDADIGETLGRAFRNPAYPEAPISARQLLAHTSSVRDPAVYWVAAPGDFWSLFGGAPPFSQEKGQGPGAYFTYANLNYGVLATLMERAAGERFDVFMRRAVFAPLGLEAGYNWSGVGAEARADGAPLHRWDAAGKRWRETIDGAAMRDGDGPVFLAEDGIDRKTYLARYYPGENATLFSPQGGLRASAADLAILARAVHEEPRLRDIVWRNNQPGDSDGGFYEAFGLGVHFVETAFFLREGERLIGHAGEAYGLRSGAWALLSADPARDGLVVAFVLTGTDAAANQLDAAAPGFTRAGAALMAAGLAHAGKAGE